MVKGKGKLDIHLIYIDENTLAFYGEQFISWH